MSGHVITEDMQKQADAFVAALNKYGCPVDSVEWENGILRIFADKYHRIDKRHARSRAINKIKPTIKFIFYGSKLALARRLPSYSKYKAKYERECGVTPQIVSDEAFVTRMIDNLDNMFFDGGEQVQ